VQKELHTPATMALGMLLDRIIEQRVYGRILLGEIDKELAQEKSNRHKKLSQATANGGVECPQSLPASIKTTIHFSRSCDEHKGAASVVQLSGTLKLPHLHHIFFPCSLLTLYPVFNDKY
jgi:hypothetical protein